MNNTLKLLMAGCAFCVSLSLSENGLAQTTYTQTNALAFSTGTNGVDKSATILPNDVSTFSNAVATAAAAGTGGVFDFPTAVPLNTTVFRGLYAGGSKRAHLVSSVTMQNVTAGTFTPVSGANMTTSSGNQSAYSIAVGPLYDVETDLALPTEVIKRIGFVVPARNSANYPLDLRVTAYFSDGSIEVVNSTIGTPRSTDDTFFGFTAPGELWITNVLLQAFAPDTEDPRADRIGIDDFGFITGTTTAAPQPQIVNVNVDPFVIHNSTNGIQFEAFTYVSIDPTNVSLTLNAEDVSGQLVFSGDSTNYQVSYSGLLPDQEYEMTISVTSPGGVATLSRTFYTKTNAFVLFDSESFSSDEIYPVGALQPVTHGRGTWSPNATEPAEIVNVGDVHGKVLQRLATGVSRPDYLTFPQVSSGTLTIEFDVLVSSTQFRTIDISLSAPGSGQMGAFLAWGEAGGKLAYFDNVNWLPLADIPSEWHRCKIVNYLSGPAAGRYDVLINDVVVGEKLSWRNAPVGTAFGQLRYHTQNTASLFESGNIDNLVITAGPEDPNAVLPPTIHNITPADRTIIDPADGLQFEVTSVLPVATTNVVLRLNGEVVDLVFTGTANHLFVSYDQLTNGNYSVEIQASSAAGTSTETFSFLATTEDWLIHPADGWFGSWQWTSGNPELKSENPLDAAGPYIHLNTTGGPRNFMREYQSGPSLDITSPHYIRWKFRLIDADFDSLFSAFNDRVHFFAHPVSRVNASTTGGNSWAIMAAGLAHASGANAGQTFWIFDNVEGNGTFNLANHVDSQVLLRPGHTYAFEVLVMPADKTYLVKIVDETGGASFTSSAPHRFRDLTDVTHNFLHFGIQAASGSTVRAFDLDSVFVSPKGAFPVELLNPNRNGSTFSFSFNSQEGVNHVVQYKADLQAGEWTTLETIVGDGTVKNVVHNNTPAGTLFYRIDSE